MDFAIRGSDEQIAHDDGFHNDQHLELKADFTIPNPPFNISDRRGDRLRVHNGWQFAAPPAGNANFAWVQVR